MGFLLGARAPCQDSGTPKAFCKLRERSESVAAATAAVLQAVGAADRDRRP
jgi:hypothetical protein